MWLEVTSWPFPHHIIRPITWLELIDLINFSSIQFYKSFLEEKYNVNTKRAIVKNTITVKVW